MASKGKNGGGIIPLNKELKVALEALRDFAAAKCAEKTDTVGQFLDDCCKENLEAKASAKDFYDAYRGWCYSNGETALANHELGKQLKEREFTTTRTKSIRGWGGLELIETPDPVLEF